MKTTKMECVACDNAEVLKGKRTIHKYKECGLDYVTLTGILEFKCLKCGEVYLEIPNLQQLHHLIAKALMKKSTNLNGTEVRYLRKELGYSTEQFSKLISYDSKSLSRIENGHQKITSTFDRLIRMAYASGKRDLDYDLHDYLLGKDGGLCRHLELTLKGDEWNLKVQAA